MDGKTDWIRHLVLVERPVRKRPVDRGNPVIRECLRLDSPAASFGLLGSIGGDGLLHGLGLHAALDPNGRKSLLSTLEGAQMDMETCLSRKRESVSGLAHRPRGPRGDDIDRRVQEGSRVVQLVMDGSNLLSDPSDLEMEKKAIHWLTLGVRAFERAEMVGADWLPAESLWQHSLRTGWLAGLLASEHHGNRAEIMRACLAGLLHDVGLVILATLERARYASVMARARRSSRPLIALEREAFGVSHDEVGASWLHHLRVAPSIIEAVAYHDEPFRSADPKFSAVTAVYVANLLDGGGWPQDGDGIPSEQAMNHVAGRMATDAWGRWGNWLARVRGGGGRV